MKKYNHKKIEKKWQKAWEESGIYKTGRISKKPKHYVLDMFPYLSGEGLHVGHPRGYIGTDIYSRWKRMNGYNILHPMGFDSFGLPAEQYAIKHKIHPSIAVKKNVKRFKKQLSILGFDYDWDREVVTSDPDYYKWTQWIFLKLYEKGLAYESYEPINWCPTCQTGLANEDLEEGKCERCGTVVEKKPMRQWILKIREYADRLLSDLDELNWPESIKESQRNWIGRSEGSLISFALVPINPNKKPINTDKDPGRSGKSQGKSVASIEVFTTRPDTLFGATYMVLSPEHPLLGGLKAQITNWGEVEKYIEEAKKKTEIERTAEGKEKSGVELKGVKAINPANKEKIPVWVADYVLVHYGTGAIMAVPAHDQRDIEFAKKYGLSIRNVIVPLFRTTSGKDAIRDDKKTAKRKNIYVVVKHHKDDKYICLNWKKFGWHSFIIGGIKDGESDIEAASREIIEETGYKNFKFVKKIDGDHHSHFFAGNKDVNRYAIGTALFFELENDEKGKISDTEKAVHDVVWVEKNKVDEFLNLSNQFYIWKKFNDNNIAYTDNGVLVNSGKFDGMDSEEVKDEITEFVGGKKMVNYKLRDWVFARQRYWGEPIPIIHCEKCGVVPVPEKDLPVILPEVKNYEPTGTGESPLANIEKWVNTKCPKCGGKGKRETNTMPQWAGSSWYYLRYIDPKNKKELVDKEKEKYWSPVDLYVGGTEHATRHLIYARFWHKFLYDIRVVNYKEPFAQLRNQGLILADDGRKMSKRWGNVINPDDIIEVYGADTLRLYEMFMGPFEQPVNWSTESIIGPRRFLERVWDYAQTYLDSKEKRPGTLHRGEIEPLLQPRRLP